MIYVIIVFLFLFIGIVFYYISCIYRISFITLLLVDTLNQIMTTIINIYRVWI